MINHETHDEEDFDRIVGDEPSRRTLESLSILPHQWALLEADQRSILKLGVKILVRSSIQGEWPACYVGTENQIEVADDFLKSGSLTSKEKVATLLHEVGHAIASYRAKQEEQENADRECNPYVGSIDRLFGDNRKAVALKEEFFADDYARHCGFTEPLKSAIERLQADHPDIFKPYPTNNRLARIASRIEPDLSLLEDLLDL